MQQIEARHDCRREELLPPPEPERTPPTGAQPRVRLNQRNTKRKTQDNMGQHIRQSGRKHKGWRVEEPGGILTFDAEIEECWLGDTKNKRVHKAKKDRNNIPR